jgi:hypothetical protein
LIPLGLIFFTTSSLLRTDHDRLSQEQRLFGVSAVVSGRYVDADTSSGTPMATGHYRVTVPDSAPAGIAGTSQIVNCGVHYGFPPSTKFPAEQDQLITWTPDGTVGSVDCGDRGTIEAVTAESVDIAQGGVSATAAGNLAATIALIVLPIGLAATAVILSIRRARAKRALIGPPPSPAPH